MQSVDRIVAVLSCLAKAPQGLGVTELFALTDLPKSTLHRTLTSLVEHDLAIQDLQTKKYKLGTLLLRLGGDYLAQNDVRTIARPFLGQANQELGETVCLSVLEHDRVICVDSISSTRDSDFYVCVGGEMPFNATAAGKVILAFQPNEYINRMLTAGELTRQTERTIVSADLLRKNLASIRILGYSLCQEENRVGVLAVAAPIYSQQEQVSAAISVVAESARMQGEYLEGVIDVLLATAQAISRSGGFREYSRSK